MASLEQLDFQAPRTPAAQELARLLAAHAELEARLDRFDREQTDAGERVARASAALVELEAAELDGKKVTAEARTKAETELAKARSAFAEPWGERRAAITRTVAADRGRVQRYVGENLAALVAEVEEDGSEAAEAVDTSAARLVAAAHERERHARRLDALVASVRGRSQYGDVAVSAADEAVRAAQRFLSEGGETPPALRAGLLPESSVTADEAA